MLRVAKIIVFMSLLGLYSSILLAGDIGVDGSVTATDFIGNGAGLTGVVKTEVDPVVDTLSADKWCGADPTGAVIQCNQDVSAPTTFMVWVPKTGQTKCWYEIGLTRDCTDTGEDGEYQMGGKTITPEGRNDWHPFSFRANPRFTDSNDGTVTDNLTGLVWLKNANCISDNPGFDNDGTVDDGRVTWQHSLDFVRKVNTGFYDCGDTSNSDASQTDWRLPNVNELLSLTDLSQTNPALPSGHPFSGVVSLPYWSSTTYGASTTRAWVVYLSTGLVFGDNPKTNHYYAWPVRDGQ